MKPMTRRWLFWLPRVLTILFALFLGVFALDVFEEGLGFWRSVLALLMHLTPTWIVLVVLAVSWRWEWVGAVLYTALAVLYAWFAVGRGHPEWTLIISVPLLLVGGLFLLDWLRRPSLHGLSQ